MQLKDSALNYVLNTVYESVCYSVDVEVRMVVLRSVGRSVSSYVYLSSYDSIKAFIIKSYDT